VKILLATISARRATLSSGTAPLAEEYLKRSQRFTQVEHRVFASEELLLRHLEAASARTRPVLFIADSGGKLLTSDEFAAELGRGQAAGTQLAVIAIGPADGWSPIARKRADLALSFGRITLPHELAAVVAAEQIYRALTIIAGHPYHSGH
jgi:23S rRNA (pseudouridine1915-N3)-methyltransferase